MGIFSFLLILSAQSFTMFYTDLFARQSGKDKKKNTNTWAFPRFKVIETIIGNTSMTSHLCHAFRHTAPLKTFSI